jgi:3-oxoadipate enol-lactonase
MAYYDRDGRRNYFLEFGRGRPVVLLHGLDNSGRAWAPQIAALVEAGSRVIVPDLAGHGASAAVNRPFGLQDLAADVIALLAHLDLASADVVGLSLGAMMTVQLALEQPELIRRIVVANGFATTATPDFKKMAASWAGIFRAQDGAVTILEQSWPVLVNESFRSSSEGRRTYQVWHGVAAAMHGPSLAYILDGIVGADLRDRLASLQAKALFISGEKDSMAPPDTVRRMADAVAGARYIELAGACHVSNADSAVTFNQELVRFLMWE